MVRVLASFFVVLSVGFGCSDADSVEKSTADTSGSTDIIDMATDAVDGTDHASAGDGNIESDDIGTAEQTGSDLSIDGADTSDAVDGLNATDSVDTADALDGADGTDIADSRDEIDAEDTVDGRDSPEPGNRTTPCPIASIDTPLDFVAGVTTVTVTYDSDGVQSQRDIALVAPQNFNPTKDHAVYFLFHGSGGNKQSTIGACQQALSNGSKILCVAVDGGPSPEPNKQGGFWNLGQGQSTEDDLALVLSIWDQLSTLPYVNPEKLYALGFSMGSAFAGNVLTNSSCSPFRGVVQVASQLWVDTVVSSPNAMKVLIIHGDADGLIPYEGGTSLVGADFLSIDESLGTWAEHNGCNDAAPSVVETDQYIRRSYPCDVPVVSYLLKGVDHGTSVQSVHSQGPVHMADAIFEGLGPLP